MKKYNEFIKENSRFMTSIGGDIIFAGKSKYPVGTKIKFKDAGKYLTGTITHPFGFCHGDVGVYLDQKGVYTDDKMCLRNREYVVDDDEVEDFIKQCKLKKAANKYNL